jgi:hypothetical protein
VGVTVGIVRVDGRQLDDRGHSHTVERVADVERGVEGLERAAHVGQPEMSDLEVNAGVGGVELPLAGGEGECWRARDVGHRVLRGESAVIQEILVLVTIT